MQLEHWQLVDAERPPAALVQLDSHQHFRRPCRRHEHLEDPQVGLGVHHHGCEVMVEDQCEDPDYVMIAPILVSYSDVCSEVDRLHDRYELGVSSFYLVGMPDIHTQHPPHQDTCSRLEHGCVRCDHSSSDVCKLRTSLECQEKWDNVQYAVVSSASFS